MHADKCEKLAASEPEVSTAMEKIFLVLTADQSDESLYIVYEN
jgi:hypothetical protein